MPGHATLRRGGALVVVVVGLLLALSSAAGAAPAPRRTALGAVVLSALGAGYTLTAQGPLAASQFPAGSPEESAAAGALARLGGTIETYQRSWQDAADVNQAQVLLVRFSTAADARAYVDAARRALARGEVVGSGPLRGVPAAQRTTYFASTKQAGVGQAITLRVGSSAALLTFFSGATGNADPITPAGAARVAKAQYAAMVAAAGPTAAKGPAGGVSFGDVGWAVLVVVLLAGAVATPLALRRGRVSPPRMPPRPPPGRGSSSG
jgi:hypothetical protein